MREKSPQLKRVPSVKTTDRYQGYISRNPNFHHANEFEPVLKSSQNTIYGLNKGEEEKPE
jgi:hypothetical protein